MIAARTSRDRPLPVAVIGAGFSGTMAAIQLLGALPHARPVLLCERGGSFGRGRAYSTKALDHLLNVRASNMSAYPDRPAHFETWLSALASGVAAELSGLAHTAAGTFAPRGLYGLYLSQMLMEAVKAEGAPRLHLVHDAVTDLEPAQHGYTLRTEGGQSHAVAGAVLAMGNLAAPEEPASRHRADPWRPETFGRLHPDRPVLIVGTGLSMVDAVATLREHGFTGPIIALSRRGLLSTIHAPARPWPLPSFSADELASLPRLTRRVRREIRSAREAGVGWHDVIDGLRPITDSLWRNLPNSERARFLRHLRPFWDVHRHRTAPPAAATIREEIARGSLTVRAGRVLAIADEAAQAVVTIRPRGKSDSEPLAVQCILDASGIGRVAETTEPLLKKLIVRGLVRVGPFGLGLDADEGFRALGPASSTRLWTLGPLLRGVLWECTAVPDIRNQAADLAAIVATEFDGAAVA